MKNLLLIIMLTMIGCGSNYEKLSDDIDALRNEEKAIINLEATLNDYIKAKNKYETELKELEKVREENDDKGYPVGPDFDSSLELEEQKELLKKNQSAISDQIYKLEGEKKDIVNNDAGI